MPLDVIAHAPKSATLRHLEVPLEAYEGEETVALSYDPAQYNAQIEALISDGFETRPAQVCREILTTFVTEWDLTANGEPIPLTVEGLHLVRLFEIQVPLVNAIMEDMGELGKELQAGSQQRSSGAKRPRKK